MGILLVKIKLFSNGEPTVGGKPRIILVKRFSRDTSSLRSRAAHSNAYPTDDSIATSKSVVTGDWFLAFLIKTWRNSGENGCTRTASLFFGGGHGL